MPFNSAFSHMGPPWILQITHGSLFASTFSHAVPDTWDNKTTELLDFFLLSHLSRRQPFILQFFSVSGVDYYWLLCPVICTCTHRLFTVSPALPIIFHETDCAGAPTTCWEPYMRPSMITPPGFKAHFFRLDSFPLFSGKPVTEFPSLPRFWFLSTSSRSAIRSLGITIVQLLGR